MLDFGMAPGSGQASVLSQVSTGIVENMNESFRRNLKWEKLKLNIDPKLLFKNTQ